MRNKLLLSAIAVALVFGLCSTVQAGRRGVDSADRASVNGSVTLHRLFVEHTSWLLRLARSIETADPDYGPIRPDGLSDDPDPVGVKDDPDDDNEDDDRPGSGSDSNNTEDPYGTWGPSLGATSSGD